MKGDAYAKGGPSVYVAAGGVKCELAFLDAQLEFTVETALRGDSQGIYLESGIYGQVTVSTLNGKVSLFAQAGYCPICTEYEMELFSWPGLSKAWMLFEAYTDKLYLYTAPATKDDVEEKSLKWEKKRDAQEEADKITKGKGLEEGQSQKTVLVGATDGRTVVTAHGQSTRNVAGGASKPIGHKKDDAKKDTSDKKKKKRRKKRKKRKRPAWLSGSGGSSSSSGSAQSGSKTRPKTTRPSKTRPSKTRPSSSSGSKTR